MKASDEALEEAEAREEAIQAAINMMLIECDPEGSNLTACAGPPVCSGEHDEDYQLSCRLCERIFVDPDGNVHRTQGSA